MAWIQASCRGDSWYSFSRMWSPSLNANMEDIRDFIGYAYHSLHRHYYSGGKDEV